MEKKSYEVLELDVAEFENVDVLESGNATAGGNGNGNGNLQPLGAPDPDCH